MSDNEYRKPKVVWLYNYGASGGDKMQATTLVRNRGYIPLQAEPIPGGADDVLSVKSSAGDYKLYYPVNRIVPALKQLKAEVVVLHTITSAVIKELPEICSNYVTAIRFGFNNTEMLTLGRDYQSVYREVWTIMETVDCIIVPHEWVARQVRAMGWENVIIIPSCIDVQRQLDIGTSSIDNRDIIAMVGRFTPIKNHLSPMLAMKKVAREIPTARLKIMGDGFLQTMYNNIIKSLHLEGVVDILPGGDPRKLYKDARLFIHSSLSENMSLTLLEAMAAGLPTIASDIEGNHIYQNERGSILYTPTDDIAGYADLIINLLRNKGLCSTMREKAMERSWTYDVNRIGDCYDALFAKLTKRLRFKGITNFIAPGGDTD